MKKTLLTIAMLAASLTVSAQTLTKSEVSAAVQQNTGYKVVDVEDGPFEGVYQVVTETGVVYTSKDGKYLLIGSAHKLEPSLYNVTQERNLKLFKREIDELYNDFITYRAPEQKHEVIVFYDHSCGYCQKMHSEIAAYNAMGITVHYAAYPREGILARDGSGRKTGSFNHLQNIWCAENKNLAFNMVARQAQIPTASCETTIERQYKLGGKLGVSGTPAVYALNGMEVMRGYAKAEFLKRRLEEMSL